MLAIATKLSGVVNPLPSMKEMSTLQLAMNQM